MAVTRALRIVVDDPDDDVSSVDLVSLRMAIEILDGTMGLGTLTATQLAQISINNAVDPSGDVAFDATLDGQTITLVNGALPAITGNMTITGPGAGLLAVSGNNADQVFQVASGAVVTISGLTIEDGNTSHGAIPSGGGIYNSGTLTLTGDVVTHNYSIGAGGGIGNFGTLTLTDSTVSYNTSAYTAGGIASSGTLTVTDSTVSHNTTLGPFSRGGGLSVAGTVTLTDSTVSDNSDPSGLPDGGGLYSSGETACDDQHRQQHVLR